MLDRMKNYVMDTAFHLSYSDMGLNIVNYTSIITMEPTRISLKYKDGTLVVTGVNLAVKKLMEEELLIVGKFSSIEFR